MSDKWELRTNDTLKSMLDAIDAFHKSMPDKSKIIEKIICGRGVYEKIESGTKDARLSFLYGIEVFVCDYIQPQAVMWMDANGNPHMIATGVREAEDGVKSAKQMLDEEEK